MTLRRLTRPARHRVIALILLMLRVMLLLLPRRWIQFLGQITGRSIGFLLRRDSVAIRQRLNASCAQISVGQTWADLGRRLFEFLALEKFLGTVVVDDTAIAAFESAQSEGTGVLVAVSHVGNWELMAAALAKSGYEIYAIAAQPSPGPINDALARLRRKWKVNTLHKGRGARRAQRLLNSGSNVAVFCDQSTGEKSRLVPFLGRPAATPVTFERLQRLTDSRPLLVWNLYQAPNQYRVYAEQIPEDVDSTTWIQARLGEIIAKNPKQWVWLHDRWPSASMDSRVSLNSELLSQ